MEKITLKLWSPTQAAKDLPGVWAWIKAMTAIRDTYRAKLKDIQKGETC